jgi:hypothetical protein
MEMEVEVEVEFNLMESCEHKLKIMIANSLMHICMV